MYKLKMYTLYMQCAGSYTVQLCAYSIHSNLSTQVCETGFLERLVAINRPTCRVWASLTAVHSMDLFTPIWCMDQKVINANLPCCHSHGENNWSSPSPSSSILLPRPYTQL